MLLDFYYNFNVFSKKNANRIFDHLKKNIYFQS